MDEPEVLNTIETRHEKLRSVACLNEEQIWTSGDILISNVSIFKVYYRRQSKDSQKTDQVI